MLSLFQRNFTILLFFRFQPFLRTLKGRIFFIYLFFFFNVHKLSIRVFNARSIRDEENWDIDVYCIQISYFSSKRLVPESTIAGKHHQNYQYLNAQSFSLVRPHFSMKFQSKCVGEISLQTWLKGFSLYTWGNWELKSVITAIQQYKGLQSL